MLVQFRLEKTIKLKIQMIAQSTARAQEIWATNSAIETSAPGWDLETSASGRTIETLALSYWATLVAL